MWVSDKWTDYELLDTSSGERLERWGDRIMVRPDPQVIWDTPKRDRRWNTADAKYSRSSTGGGSWEKKALPESWQIKYGDLVFNIKPMNFKHTGIFPEQAANWDWAMEIIKSAGRPIKVLNLFAYTGASTAAMLSAGAEVCHVDAAKGMVAWAKENAASSGVSEKPVRWIIDDCAKFVQREIRREHKYDAIVMDPPSYGRGPSGEVWKLENDLMPFVRLCAGVLSDDPLFVLINSYTTGLSPSTISYVAESVFSPKFGGKARADELGLPVSSTGLCLPCGAACRMEF